MNDIAIRVEKLGKQYRIGKRERYQTLRDTLTDTVAAPFRWLRNGRSANGNGAPEHIWALKDISFEIPRGEVVGIIGRNGAGKSTLLKVLSRITEPTEGRAEIHGRVGSLLEVGTGFHPELTGRENVYLNGAILGMHKAEIAGKFDEIVAFAEIEAFLDTPVKHYSSGMYMRLAFAVAAHLEPEILLIDEVLAVGDVAFQKKCLGKISDVANQGRTVLFVSHNLIAVENLCPRSVLLRRGEVLEAGETRQVLGEYLSEQGGIPKDLALHPNRKGSGEIRFVSCDILPQESSARSSIRPGEDFTVRLHFRCFCQVQKPAFSLALRSSFGAPIFAVHTTDTGAEIGPVDRAGFIDLHIFRANLMPGRYLLDIAAGDDFDPHRYDLILDASELHVESSDVYRSGKLRGAGWNLVYFDCQWQMNC
jgi:lipopolysaccharide transport system ATP-binding protein